MLACLAIRRHFHDHLAEVIVLFQDTMPFANLRQRQHTIDHRAKRALICQIQHRA